MKPLLQELMMRYEKAAKTADALPKFVRLYLEKKYNGLEELEINPASIIAGEGIINFEKKLPAEIQTRLDNAIRKKLESIVAGLENAQKSA